MDVIHAPRKAGKTTAAVDWVLEDSNNRGIFVLSHGDRNSLLTRFPDLPKDSVRVLPRRGNVFDWAVELPQRQYVLDDADLVLSRLISPDIALITVNN